MPISSFYGLQTSLRGLLAQQRALDTAGHNIANASTKGYSRQEVALVASAALADPGRRHRRRRRRAPRLGRRRPVASAASATSSSTSSTAARTRTSASGRRAPKTLDRAELALTEPGENGINEQLAQFWDAWSQLASDAKNPALKQNARRAGRARSPGRSTRSTTRSPSPASRRAPSTTTGRAAGPATRAARSRRSPGRSPQLNDTISRFVTAGDMPNDLLDRRDQLLDELSQFGQVSVVEQPDGRSTSRSATDAAPPSRRSSTGSTPGRPATPATPGGRLGGLLEASSTPAARSTATSPISTRSPRSCRRPSTPRYPAATSSPSAPPAPPQTLHARPGARRQPVADRRRHRRRGRERRRAARSRRSATSRQRRRRRLPGVRRQGRRRRPRGDPAGGQRPGADRRGREPAPERVRRLDGRGDVQPRALPALLPGLLACHEHDGRDARRPDQPHRKGGSVMAMRITTSMVQRNVLADLNGISSKLTRTQMKAASGKEISRPSDDPFATVAGDGAAPEPEPPTASTSATSRTPWAGRTRPSRRSWTSPSRSRTRRRLLVQGGTDSADPTSREAIAAELEQIIEGIKQSANTNYRGSFLFAGTETSTRPYPRRASRTSPPTTSTRATTAAGTRDARDRARDRPERADHDQRRRPRVPRRRPGRCRQQAARTSCATRSTTCAPATAPTLRGTDLDRARHELRPPARGPRRQRREDQPPRGRPRPARPARGVRARSALGDRGRRHRQDPDRPQLPDRRLPGRPPCGGQHRPSPPSWTSCADPAHVLIVPRNQGVKPQCPP